MSKILNYMLFMNEETGEYIQNPPLLYHLRIIHKISSIYPFKLKLLNILGYHRLCKLNRLIHKIYRHH